MTEPYRYLDEDQFCLSARLLPDLNAGGVTDTLSITIEGSDEPQSVHVPAGDVPAVAAGIVAAAGQQSAAASAPVSPAPADRAALLRTAALIEERADDLWAPGTKANDEMRADAAELRCLADAASGPGGVAGETQALDVEPLARLLSAADVALHNGNYPSFDELAESGEQQYLNMARWLLKRLRITDRTPAAVSQPETEA